MIEERDLYEPPDMVEITEQESDTETLRYSQVYNDCIWSNKWGARLVYSLPVWCGELCPSNYIVRCVSYTNTN